jgi:hypothetical protein
VKAIRTKDQGLLFKSLATDASRMHMALADYLLQFRKPGDNPEPIRAGVSERYGNPDGWITAEEWIEWAAPVWYRASEHYPGGIRETDVLNAAVARDAPDERHIAPLQLGVIERAVKLWSEPGRPRVLAVRRDRVRGRRRAPQRPPVRRRRVEAVLLRDGLPSPGGNCRCLPRGRCRPLLRHFDHDEARRLRAAGWTYKAAAESSCGHTHARRGPATASRVSPRNGGRRRRCSTAPRFATETTGAGATSAATRRLRRAGDGGRRPRESSQVDHGARVEARAVPLSI